MSLPPFLSRHAGPDEAQIAAMLQAIGQPSLSALVEKTLPEAIRMAGTLSLPEPLTERQALEALAERADENRVFRSYLGMGYYGTLTPTVLLRNILENPGWYTASTPYQAEISQGRLEALLVFQTVVEELCGMDIANASLLDEATAAAEAMTMSHRLTKGKRRQFFVDEGVHPQTLAVLQTRAAPLGIELVVGDAGAIDDPQSLCGALVQYPSTTGVVTDLEPIAQRLQDGGAKLVVATDLLALCLLRSPGEQGADIVVGNSQRFGVPMGYGGPHAAFMATRTAYQRHMPGRIIGVSVDAHGAPALRMALQTREQHIRRQKATSNICTAQVLLAVVAGMYAVWHGPEGLAAIAERVHGQAQVLRAGLAAAGYDVGDHAIFDTVCVRVPGRADALLGAALALEINLRRVDADTLAIALDETVRTSDVDELLDLFGAERVEAVSRLEDRFRRSDAILRQPVFHNHRSETEMLRYLHKLESRDLTLTTSMISLGSCTMKLNATTEMIPVTWAGFNGLHPFAPKDQAAGYQRLFEELETWLGEITGFDAVSLQPNAGSQGEYAGLLAIRRYHESRGEGDSRTLCLIPSSAHGTNPASAVMAGMKVVVVKCDELGNIDIDDLRAKIDKHGEKVGALMVTYPSTHGVFEEAIVEICEMVHGVGGQVYMDGANMNAMVGLCRPADIGADVCHLNLHKTFCIPHGGGGPGMGPIGVRAHLAPFLPGHPVIGPNGAPDSRGTVSAAPWGSPSILPITWAYIAMLGSPGLTRATEVAILNANYIASRLVGHYEVLYRGHEGMVAHECILDTRPFKAAGIAVDDIAKRLIDYGFHAPTMSFPVVGTLMVEPTESESKPELDRFCDAMIAIGEEIAAVVEGRSDPEDNALKHSPHTALAVTADEWRHGYSRQEAAYPAPWTRDHKYWPHVGRIDNAHGDRNLICSCDAWPDGA